MASRPIVALVALALVAACTSTTSVDGGTDGAATDAGGDAATDAGGDAGADGGGTCTDVGRYECTGGSGRECCGGTWQTFVDGPCWSLPDGGAGSCTTTPESPGCPCTTAGATACRLYQSRLQCMGGSWVADVGHVCCT